MFRRGPVPIVYLLLLSIDKVPTRSYRIVYERDKILGVQL